MDQQLGDVVRLVAVLLELTFELLSNGRLLRLEERVEQHLDSIVDVVNADVVAQVELGKGLRHADYRLNVSNGDRNTAGHRGLATDFRVEVHDLVLVDLRELGLDKALRVYEVLLQELLRNELFGLLHLGADLAVEGARLGIGIQLSVRLRFLVVS